MTKPHRHNVGFCLYPILPRSEDVKWAHAELAAIERPGTGSVNTSRQFAGLSH